MGAIDFSPLFRSTVGFDRLTGLLADIMQVEPADNYPPYNIEKLGDDAYRITMAVAGFTPDDLAVTAHPNLLVVAARGRMQDNARYLHHGLATRPFERRFSLADYVAVKGASLENGLLSIELVRELPEAMKPRAIPIGAAPPKALEALEALAADAWKAA